MIRSASWMVSGSGRAHGGVNSRGRRLRSRSSDRAPPGQTRRAARSGSCSAAWLTSTGGCQSWGHLGVGELAHRGVGAKQGLPAQRVAVLLIPWSVASRPLLSRPQLAHFDQGGSPLGRGAGPRRVQEEVGQHERAVADPIADVLDDPVRVLDVGVVGASVAVEGQGFAEISVLRGEGQPDAGGPYLNSDPPRPMM